MNREAVEYDPVVAAVEAILFAAGEPVHPKEIASALGEGLDEEAVAAAVDALSRALDERRSALHVERVAGAFRLATRSELGAQVRQFFRQRNRTRLSPAALETLAIVAYRQPVLRADVEKIRGVACGEVLRTLQERGLVRVAARADLPGAPLLYGTTQRFLEAFGLRDLQDLPRDRDLFRPPGDAAPSAG